MRTALRLLPCLCLLSLVGCGKPASEANSVESEARRVTMEMVEAWNQLDWDRVIDLFAEDAVFQSMMKEPVVGRNTIDAYFRPLFEGIERIDLQLRNVVVENTLVVIERVDDFVYDGNHGRVPVVGVLEIADGKVVAWREYYDHAQLAEAMSGAETP